MEKILITGGSGFLGTRLTNFLVEKGYEVSHLSRTPGVYKGIKRYEWHPAKGEIDAEALKDVDYIFHLAGADISAKRWTKERKKVIIESRTSGPEVILKNIDKQNTKLKGFFGSSALGYFGAVTSDKILTEEDPPANDYISNVVVQWEASVMQMQEICRVAMFRFGFILDKKNGALPKFATPVKWCVGAALGSGKQWMPWIHIDDVISLFYFALQNENVQGIYNAAGAEHINNKDLTKKLASVLGRKIILPNIPHFALRIALGELADVVVTGSRASSEKIRKEGFQFKYDDVETVLKEIYKK